MKRISFAAALAMVACGGSNTSDFIDPNGGGGAGTGGGTDGVLVGGENIPRGTQSACVSSVASATLLPTNLVFMYDKSGSMGDTRTGFDPAKRWIPLGAGMKDFFSAPESKNLNASLQFFPMGGDLADVCAYPYATPRVPLASLADPSPFVNAIAAEAPNGGTPTTPALRGALTYAETVLASRSDEKVAIVLVTDGEPGFWNDAAKAVEPGCADNSVSGAGAVAAEAKAKGIPVYVIGVGPALGNLNAIAVQGGSGAAQMVDVTDPSRTKSLFLASLDTIRKQTATCTFAIPPAPAGQTLDYNAVNVVVTNSQGTERVLSYSATCSDPNGWRYDNADRPTRVELCEAVCSAQSVDSAKLQLAFGCKTQTSTR
jgi:hypothetical protein